MMAHADEIRRLHGVFRLCLLLSYHVRARRSDTISSVGLFALPMIRIPCHIYSFGSRYRDPDSKASSYGTISGKAPDESLIWASLIFNRTRRGSLACDSLVFWEGSQE